MARSELEKEIEARCVALARHHDGELLTFRTRGKGWHDRLLLLPRGRMALIEFKRGPKAALQPLQNLRQAWCEERNIPAYRIWSYRQFADIVSDILATTAR